jgi:hypothetical protein
MISFAQQAYDDDAASGERQRNAITQAVVSPRILPLERDQNWSKLTTIENESRLVKYCLNVITQPIQCSEAIMRLMIEMLEKKPRMPQSSIWSRRAIARRARQSREKHI